MNKKVLNEIIKKVDVNKELVILYKANDEEKEYLSSYDIRCEVIQVELHGLLGDYKVSHIFYRYYKL